MRFHRPQGLLAGFSWRSGDEPGFPVLEAGEQWSPREWPIREHANLGWEVYYQPLGYSRWECAGQHFELGNGGYYLIAPGVRHRLREFHAAGAHYFFAVLPERCESGDLPAWPRPFACGAQGFSLETPFRGLMRELTLSSDERQEGLACYAAALRLEVNRLLTKGPEGSTLLQRHPAVDRALELFESRPAERWRLDELAALCGVSVAHLIALFRRDTGQTPRQYLLRRRIERAEETLRSSGRSVTGVALEMGFSSSQHFARTYRKLRGRCVSGRLGRSPRHR